jgi:hypothetical protein
MKLKAASLFLAALATACGQSVTKGAIPYKLDFVQVYGDTSPTPQPVFPPPPPQPPPQPNPPPALQPMHAYCAAPDPSGGWYIVSGRWWQGLHQFNSNQGAQNFWAQAANSYLWFIDPVSKTATQLLDLRTLPPKLGAPLMATNVQCDYNPSTDTWLLAGGYGIDPSSATGGMTPFDQLMLLQPKKIAGIMRNQSLSAQQKLAAVAAGIQVATGAPAGFFQTSGGALRKFSTPTSTTYLLFFGQNFQGNYNPFNQVGQQTYVEEIREFRISTNPLRVVSTGKLTPPAGGANDDHPFHRRDLPVVDSIDPATAKPRLTAFGGVFPPGLIAGYMYPVHVVMPNTMLQFVVDRKAIKKFSQYQCPTVVVWDSSGKTVYHTFFGGIGHYYYSYDAYQMQVYNYVTKVGRNDGLPFTEDITTFLQNADGSTAEYIAPDPIANHKLRGASVDFIPAPGASHYVLSNGVFNLQAFQANSRVLIGYIYGGVEAVYPLPVIPSYGTAATNALYEVYLTRAPWDGIPASQGHEATGVFQHGDTSGKSGKRQP